MVLPFDLWTSRSSSRLSVAPYRSIWGRGPGQGGGTGGEGQATNGEEGVQGAKCGKR